MKLLLKKGLKVLQMHRIILLFLCLYQTAWAFLLFQIINTILNPIVRSYPNIANQPNAAQLYLLEIKFQVLKTDMITPYLYGFMILLLIRMLITPFIHGGLYYSLANSENQPMHTSFIEGIKLKSKAMLACYWIKNVLIFAPLIIYLLPFIKQLSNSSVVIDWSFLLSAETIFICLWIIAVATTAYCIQLGIACNYAWLKVLNRSVKHGFKLLAITIVIGSIGLLSQAAIHSTTILWYSLFTMLLFWLLPAIRTITKVWTISSHLHAVQQ